MSTTKKFTIWLIPPEPIFGNLQKIIDRLSNEYRGPRFEPHITLLAGFPAENLSVVKQKVKNLANFDKLELTLGPVSFSTTYFQSVFVRINSTAQLMQMNLDAKRLFDVQNDVFMPHASLMYGNHDMETREKAAQSVKIPKSSFSVDSFSIVSASNDPSDWKILSTVPFTGR